MKQPLPPEALAAWDRGEKLLAIRIARERMGIGLAEASKAFASGARSLPAKPGLGEPQLPPQALAAARRGEVVEAIKLTREATGLGLKEAKLLVERSLAAGAAGPVAGPPPPARRPGLAPGEMPRSSSSTLVITLVVAAIAAAAWWFVRG